MNPASTTAESHVMTQPSRPGAATHAPRTIAVVGGGQLGRMLALAGAPLGFSFRFLDPDPSCPAASLGTLICGDYHDPAALASLAHDAEVVTFEFENVPAEPLAALAARVPVAPSPRSLAISQDRVEEKRLFEACGMEVAPWAPVDDAASLVAAIDAIGLPGVLKTRRMGYDGKGQRVIRARDEALAAHASLREVPCIYESLVPFSREVSVIAVRGADGACAAWPIGENCHRDGILHSTVAPAAIDAAAVALLQHHVFGIMERLDHRGVLTIEYMQHGDRLLANEMAPRVHNSGHWTIDGAVTSQFENHIRAIAGLPLGATSATGHTVMVNLVGTVPPLGALLADPSVKVHLYGKAPRRGRKLGHLTVVATDAADAARRLRELEALIDGPLSPAA